jgi:uncharacterized membrane protein
LLKIEIFYIFGGASPESMAPKGKIHRLFEISILIKGIDGVLEFLAGIALFFISSKSIASIIHFLFRYDSDADDFITDYMVHLAQALTHSTQMFGAFHLLINGIIKIAIVLALWSEKPVVFPIAGFVLSAFTLFGIVRFLHTFSSLLLFFILLDIIIIILLYYEYKLQKKNGLTVKIAR